MRKGVQKNQAVIKTCKEKKKTQVHGKIANRPSKAKVVSE